MPTDRREPHDHPRSSEGVSRRTLLRAAATATTPALIADQVTAGGTHTHAASDLENVEQLDGAALTTAAIHALLDHRTQTLLAAFTDHGVTPRVQDISGVAATQPDTGDSGQVITIPFTTDRKEAHAWIQHSSFDSIRPAPVTGFQTVHHDPGTDQEAYWDVTIFRAENGDVVRTEDRVWNLFGCPNDKVNPTGVTKLAADYTATFVSCAACVGSATVFVPACALCLAQIARMGVSLEDYNWCECDPTKNC